jgi:crotonobetainyl-CoA:carnitine CoA-transferase CaiB-like acyl-CoA transferase
LSDAATGKRALAGRRVLELADEKGVYCGKLLADMGADVLKIERPGGDATRDIPPFWGGERHPERGLFFLYTNTSKRGVTLDIRRAEGRRLFRRLAATADIVLETFPPGFLDDLELGYRSLRQANPRLVLTSITGFGQTGPYRGFKSSDIVASALGGSMVVTGEEGDPPVKLAGAQAHMMASTYAAVSSLIALHRSSISGEGQHVDISAEETTVSVSHICGVGKWLDDGIIPRRRGTSLFHSVPSGAYPCADGRVYLMINRPLHWQALARWIHEVTGNQEVLDPMFEGPPRRGSPTRAPGHLHLGFHLPVQRRRDLPRGPAAAHRLHPGPRRRGGGPRSPPGRPGLLRPGGAPGSGDAHLSGSGVQALRDSLAHRASRSGGGPAQPGDLRGGAGNRRARASLAHGGRGNLMAGEDRSAARTALGDLRVVEFTAALAGPWIGRIMAFCGAEVIRVESRKRPDVVRGYVPPWAPEMGVQPQLSPWFTDWNAGKRFVALDLTRPEAVEIARRLVAACDVVIENYSAGVMEKLGLGYSELRRVKPDLVMISTSGYGDRGPHHRYVSWGPNLEALSGLSRLSGFRRSAP